VQSERHKYRLTGRVPMWQVASVDTHTTLVRRKGACSHE
jgi:hypothetical protein